MTNPLAARSAPSSRSDVEHCPSGYSSAQTWCDWRNASMQDGGREDVEWIVGPHGTPMLIDNEQWSWRNAKKAKEREKIERERHNHRIMNPVA